MDLSKLSLADLRALQDQVSKQLKMARAAGHRKGPRRNSGHC